MTRIPSIGYSALISSFIIMLLKMLLSYENIIASIKMEKNSKSAIIYSEYAKKCIQAKYIIFIIFNFLLLFFFWYYISCFCAVYKNFQMLLIQHTIASFGSSMIYPFILNLLPGLFRIPALRLKYCCCLYVTSRILAIILL